MAQIVTFGKMFPRAATRDSARVLGHEYALGDRLAKLISDPVMGCTLPACKSASSRASRCAPRSTGMGPPSRSSRWPRGSRGSSATSSIHAAAVVIADRPLTEIAPLQIAEAGVDERGEKVYRTVTQFTMKPVEEIGLLKMDFLGLRNLDVIEDALDIIERSTGRAPGHDDAPSRRIEKTYEMMARGDSVGVFQSKSEGIGETLRRIKPSETEKDLIALNALYRPGPRRQIPTLHAGQAQPRDGQLRRRAARSRHPGGHPTG